MTMDALFFSTSIIDTHNVIAAFQDENFDSFDNTKFTHDQIDICLFKLFLLLKTPVVNEKKQIVYDFLLNIREKQGKQRAEITIDLHQQYEEHLLCQHYLRTLMQGLIDGKKLLNNKLEDLKSRDVNSAEDQCELDLINNILDSKQVTIDFCELNQIICQLYESSNPLKLQEINQLAKEFDHLISCIIAGPLQKFNYGRSFISWLQETVSDTFKKIFHVGIQSINGTLFELAEIEHNLFRLVQKETQFSSTYQTLFTPVTGNEVTFYSKAYSSETRLKGAFADIIESMECAHQYIFIAGWSLSGTEKFGPDNKSLPDVIIAQARRGIDVVILVWGGCLFADIPNKNLRRFSTEMNCKIAKLNLSESERNALKTHLHINYSYLPLGYSDHQKMIIIDPKSTPTLFIGGLDLMDGRSVRSEWHDCHAKITGPVVTDAIILFQHRWDSTNHIQMGSHALASAILKQQTAAIYHQIYMHRNPFMPDLTTPTHPTPTMHLICSLRKQFFHFNSWRTASLKPTDYTEEIKRSYNKAIRDAEKFIYMENQFFIGSYHNKSRLTLFSENTVIAEIVNKIKEKIQQDQPFHFYCLLPFQPDGSDNSFEVQVVLRKQWKTISWVIRTVDEAAQEKGKSAEDYLTFCNLGANVSGKFTQLYVHSKLLIVDDKQLIIGSANCNERSMAGNRDSEVAVHLVGHHKETKAFRVALMREHFGADLQLDNPNLLHAPETDEAHKKLHDLLNCNLITPNQLLAMPWGNIPISELMQVKKPPHVLFSSPSSFKILNAISDFPKKLVR